MYASGVPLATASPLLAVASTGAEDMMPLDPFSDSGVSEAATGDTQQDVDYPVASWHDGQPVPDLEKLAPEHWRQALTALTPEARRVAVRTARDPESNRKANLVATELELFADPPPVTPDEPRAQRPVALAQPMVDRAEVGASRQVNFRLSPAQHARLAQAVESVGARPAELARLLTMRGVEQMRWEERSRR